MFSMILAMDQDKLVGNSEGKLPFLSPPEKWEDGSTVK